MPFHEKSIALNVTRPSATRVGSPFDGYVTEMAYTRHHHAALDPGKAVWVAKKAGCATPAMRYACELGFGQGLSLAIHASAGEIQWWGVDLIPEHVEFARSLLDDPSARARLVCASFDEFDAREDLPPFDFIALHGVWSWVSPQNRTRITAFIERRLAPNGIVYVGYNALPGWGPALSLRELLVASAAQVQSARLEDRIEAAMVFVAQLVAADPRILDSQPQFEKQLREIRSKKKSYLAHEYFNRDWHPMHFSQVATELMPIGLRYLGQADFSDSYDQWRLSETQRALLGAIDDPVLRETARDVILDRRFRRDYWLRSEGAVTRSACKLREARLWLPPTISSPGAGAREETPAEAPMEMPTEVKAWVASLGTAGAIVTRSLETTADHAALSYALGRGWVELACEPAASEASRDRVAKINRRLLERVAEESEISVLASHLTGSGVELGWWTLALLAAMRRETRADAVIDRVLAQAAGLGIALARAGFALTPEETRQELQTRHSALVTQADIFRESFAI